MEKIAITLLVSVVALIAPVTTAAQGGILSTVLKGAAIGAGVGQGVACSVRCSRDAMLIGEAGGAIAGAVSGLIKGKRDSEKNRHAESAETVQSKDERRTVSTENDEPTHDRVGSLAKAATGEKCEGQIIAPRNIPPNINLKALSQTLMNGFERRGGCYDEDYKKRSPRPDLVFDIVVEDESSSQNNVSNQIYAPIVVYSNNNAVTRGRYEVHLNVYRVLGFEEQRKELLVESRPSKAASASTHIGVIVDRGWTFWSVPGYSQQRSRTENINNPLREAVRLALFYMLS